MLIPLRAPPCPVVLAPTEVSTPVDLAATLGVSLLRDREVSSDDMVTALAIQARQSGKLSDILLSRGMIARPALLAALARHWQSRVMDLQSNPADIRLLDDFDPQYCLHHHLLPWRNSGAVTLIATASPEAFASHRPLLERHFGPIGMVIASAEAIQDSLMARRGAQMVRAAEERVPAAQSCREFSGTKLLAPLAYIAIGAVALTAIWPLGVAWILLAWAVLTLLLQAGLKAACAVAELRAAPAQTDETLAIIHMPIVSVMVALYRESDIAPRLVRRLGQLDYPRELLDIVLVVEEEDSLTRAALAGSDLPPWMRVVVVPEGRIKTKPRALNFALDQCRGSIIGVYDAEDAPEPDQIQRIVRRFYQRGPQVACLQGMLDFYNPTTNWLSRCFTIEYATWFRLILPGLARLGLPIPLGGTTLFFRRAALEAVGGWDAHNVTEDADLGMRLYRYGYRTELVQTVTYEEANCRALPWVKQRSRWLKGYMMTWATHMRQPVQLYRQLGPWKFAGFHVLLLGSLSQTLLGPLLMSFWLALIGLPHPLAEAIPYSFAITMMTIFLLAEAMNISFMLIALRRSGHSFSRFWVLSLQLYFPIAAIASYKAAWELLRRPFYWDKTAHGQFDPPNG